MIQTFEHKFNIGDIVYHITPESDKGIIIDIKYSIRKRLLEYTVAFGRRSDDQIICDELELSENKIF